MRIVHIADLHLGPPTIREAIDRLVERTPVDSLNHLDRFAKRKCIVSALLHAIPGRLGHDPRALLALIQCLEQLAEDRSAPVCALYLAGDLTSAGYDEDYNLARQFLSLVAKLDQFHHRFIIHGNHDWWDNGRCWVARNLPSDIFQYPTAMGERLGLSVPVCALFIDSDGDIRRNVERSPRRQLQSFLAQGDCLDFFRDSKISFPCDALVVILMHHSVAWSEGAPAQIMVGPSKEKFVDTLGQTAAAIVLTGHTHRPGVYAIAQGAGNALPHWEFCAGTAAQKETSS